MTYLEDKDVGKQLKRKKWSWEYVGNEDHIHIWRGKNQFVQVTLSLDISVFILASFILASLACIYFSVILPLLQRYLFVSYDDAFNNLSNLLDTLVLFANFQSIQPTLMM